ncbi:hypothetical protein ACWOAQ_04185 [Helcococcus kunzii]|uniref:Uncharacterized protein n=1 Tax=Helcococcus kunzii ATCC 51366 TaxID=883114 RepID=H3NMY4_9FIRM|nr:hypothetical protein [Helcococcus kunzii]EHR34388.1 hypothetical protein HMPREF9709_00695 [Helcococcus kunzii ATCC 51366]MCT1795376.1 hypothetical protein [Helcococcus kunzii]QUY64632.1 hypothetical protein GUI37_03570 [Helcococcus kunzii]QZO77046.1 hypothetical protein HIF96_03230 [Helcococcus kunzii]
MKRIYDLTKLNIKLLKNYFIILLLQFLFMLIVFMGIVPNYRFTNQTYNTFKNSALSKSILYYNDIDAINFNVMDISKKQKNDIINKIKTNLIKLEEISRSNSNITSTSPNINRYFFEINGEKYDAEVIEKEILDIYLRDKIDLISSDNIKKNTIQAYILSNDRTRELFNIGDVFETSINNYYDDKTVNSTDVKIQIAGFLSNDIPNIISRGVYSDGISSAGLLFDYELPSVNDIHIFFEYNDLLKSIDSIDKMSSNNLFSKIIYFNQNTKDEEINKLNEKILSLNIGNSNTSKQLLENQKNNINYLLSKSVDKIIIAIILIITTIIVSSFINSKKTKKAIIIYRLNGAKIKDIIIANFITNILPFIIVFLPYTIFSLIRNSRFYANITGDIYFSKIRSLLTLNEILIISLFVFSIILIYIVLSSIKMINFYKTDKKVGK